MAMRASRAEWRVLMIVGLFSCQARGPLARAPASAGGDGEHGARDDGAPAVVVSAPPPFVAPAPPVAGTIGTAHPIAVQAVAPDGSWVVACQARADTNRDGTIGLHWGLHGDLYGDAAVPFLIVGGGEGEAIDALVASDPSGRYLVTSEGGTAVLREPALGHREVLVVADPKAAKHPFGPQRAASFDAAGHLLYLDDEARRPTPVVRTLASGAEVRIDPGPGLVHRAWLDPAGRWAFVSVVAGDSDGDGKLALPARRTTRRSGPCQGPAAIYSTYGWSGDRPTIRAVRIGEATVSDAPGVVGALGDALLRREADGSLVVDPARPRQAARTLADAPCDARVFGADSVSGNVLLACAGRATDGWAPLEIHGPGGEVVLGARTQVDGGVPWTGGDTPMVSASIDGGDGLVDLRSATLRRVALARNCCPDRILGWAGERVLLRREHGLRWFGEDGVERPLDGVIEMYGAQIQRGGIFAVEPLVVDLAGPRVLGQVDRPILGLAPTGHVLTTAGPRPIVRDVPLGPLEWVWPAPLAGE